VQAVENLPRRLDPSDYRIIRLVFFEVESSREVELSLLRHKSLVEHLGAGDTVRLRVLGMEIEGRARVIGVDPCLEIEDGPGKLVTGTIRSLHMDVRQVKLRGLDEPVGVTANHPLFSEEKGDFTAVKDLKAGERLRTRWGTAEVEEIGRKPGRWVVFNLEIEEVHQYYVSGKEVLAHNVCPEADGGDAAESEVTGTALARQLGQEGEQAANIIKNTERIDSLTGTANYRIPDILDHVEQVIGDVKNVATQGFTRQIQDSLYYALQNNYDFVLIVRQSTTFTAPLQALIDNGFVNILRLLP
jgi:hypothetical protein